MKNKKISITAIWVMLLLPLAALTRQKPDGRLTPYANAEFKDGKIV